ncbi:hypothetical protein PVL29_013665 [Vitis rotundifolia]|uniref:Uncharacterized protein n=1 Tax=Vitis rotundifolia TaxID=103349 RepID=A0AA38ZIC2_VITRO|nr:hypothetical protein PVL29_025260 [Vitis rotundifolia]KAJ9684825.1 hypothetical protein PVL29_017017 [Vitis rotundifolia]KAJ9685585.1 hypothetical protein PVL29_017572 [Vitis rotundifolia]KAJ9689359.1 hypothetical protein PVL29_014844 [Vitis rotundifolia]KAJ9691300.1 hypothetical protein PVL29_013471 [Vitis rotundifolia]
MRKFRMIMRTGTETRFAHFLNSPVFGMKIHTSVGPLKLLLPLPYAFHPSGKSFKTQLI